MSHLSYLSEQSEPGLMHTKELQKRPTFADSLVKYDQIQSAMKKETQLRIDDVDSEEERTDNILLEVKDSKMTVEPGYEQNIHTVS